MVNQLNESIPFIMVIKKEILKLYENVVIFIYYIIEIINSIIIIIYLFSIPLY